MAYIVCDNTSSQAIGPVIRMIRTLDLLYNKPQRYPKTYELRSSFVDPDTEGSVTFAGSGSITRGFRIRIWVHTRKRMLTLTKTIKRSNYIVLTILLYLIISILWKICFVGKCCFRTFKIIFFEEKGQIRNFLKVGSGPGSGTYWKVGSGSVIKSFGSTTLLRRHIFKLRWKFGKNIGIP
jgi:hypothetical protein